MYVRVCKTARFFVRGFACLKSWAVIRLRHTPPSHGKRVIGVHLPTVRRDDRAYGAAQSITVLRTLPDLFGKFNPLQIPILNFHNAH